MRRSAIQYLVPFTGESRLGQGLAGLGFNGCSTYFVKCEWLWWGTNYWGLDHYTKSRYLPGHKGTYEITLLPPPVGTGWLCHKLLSTDTAGRPWTLYSIENRYGRICEHDKPMENRSGFVVCTWLISYKQLTQASPLIGAYATLPWELADLASTNRTNVTPLFLSLY